MKSTGIKTRISGGTTSSKTCPVNAKQRNSMQTTHYISSTPQGQPGNQKGSSMPTQATLLVSHRPSNGSLTSKTRTSTGVPQISAGSPDIPTSPMHPYSLVRPQSSTKAPQTGHSRTAGGTSSNDMVSVCSIPHQPVSDYL